MGELVAYCYSFNVKFKLYVDQILICCREFGFESLLCQWPFFAFVHRVTGTKLLYVQKSRSFSIRKVLDRPGCEPVTFSMVFSNAYAFIAYDIWVLFRDFNLLDSWMVYLSKVNIFVPKSKNFIFSYRDEKTSFCKPPASTSSDVVW